MILKDSEYNNLIFLNIYLTLHLDLRVFEPRIKKLYLYHNINSCVKYLDLLNHMISYTSGIKICVMQLMLFFKHVM